MKKRYVRMCTLITLLVLIDQMLKATIVSGKTKSTYLQNFGAAFGIGDKSMILLILINIVVLGIIIKFIYSQKDRIDRKTLASFTLILAGGISNLIDRIFRGFVVDYIDIANLVKFPMFNLADICIVTGWVMLFISIIIFWYKEVRVTTNKVSTEKREEES